MNAVSRKSLALLLVTGLAGCAMSDDGTRAESARQQALSMLGSFPAKQPAAPDSEAKSKDDPPDVTVFLIGDAGAPAEGHEPVLEALEKAASEDARRNVIVFLGDNVYPDGMPDSLAPGRKEAERRINMQLDVIKQSKARGIFIPGNHEWGGISGRDGWNQVVREGAYITSKGGTIVPTPGCPGPAVVDVGTTLRLVMLDTEWWLRRSGPPESARKTVPCAFASEKSVLDSLKGVLRSTGDRHAILMSHHPVASAGEHGGFFSEETENYPLTSLKSWMRVPLPMIGSVYIAARRMGLSEQDLTSPTYSRMIRSILGTFSKDEPFIYAAGHDHDLQVLQFEGVPKYELVTGSGVFGHVSNVAKISSTRYAKAESGYMRVRAWADGRIRITVFTVDIKGQTSEVFDEWASQARNKKPEAKHAD